MLYFGVHLIFPTVSLFSISIWFVILFAIFGGVGWTILVRMFFKKGGYLFRPVHYMLFFTYYLILPWKYLSGLAIDELSSFIAKCFLPFVLILTFKYLEVRSIKNLLFLGFFIALIFLVNTNILISLLTGLFSLAVAFSLKEGRVKRIEKRIKRLLLPFLLGLLFSTLWYGPRFWWVQMVNPGIGGGNAVQVFSKILDFIRNILPLTLAITVVYFRSKFNNKFTVFAWVFFGSFLILSVFRFLADVNFWMDYSSWFNELEVGLWLISIVLFTSKKYIYILFPVFFSFLITFCAFNVLERPFLISDKPPQIVNILTKLADLSSRNTVFVTGSSTFWLNAFHNTVQVRGGRDALALNPDWRKQSYVFRESKDADKIEKGLIMLDVSCVLVNTARSLDFYKDYKNLDVWENLGTKVNEYNGDYLLNVHILGN